MHRPDPAIPMGGTPAAIGRFSTQPHLRVRVPPQQREVSRYQCDGGHG